MARPAETAASRPRITLPTWLTLGRILLCVPIGVIIVTGPSWVAALLIAIAAGTDFIDGVLARRFDAVSKLGAALDPVADKLLSVTALLAFVVAGTISGIHTLAVFAIFFRETLISGLRETVETGTVLAVSPLAKWKTAAQFLTLLALCAGASPLSIGLLWAAAALTLWTGVDYLNRWLTTVR